MNSTKQELEIAKAILSAQAEVREDKEVKESKQLEQAKEAFEERQRRTAERTVEFERRKQNPLSAEDRQRALSLLKRLNRK